MRTRKQFAECVVLTKEQEEHDGRETSSFANTEKGDIIVTDA